MRPYIELYINNQKVEFTDPPKVLLTYSHNEIHNPTIVKNSYSKTITIDGTPNNNKIFNNFADMRWVNGAGFNPSRKENFTLYRNGEPIESGYVKLDNVVRKNNTIQYQISLFGGLGQMLYELSYTEDGVEKKLSDLVYPYILSMSVDRNTVYDAWKQINGITNVNEIYDFINFAPCYNGIPKDFTANKVAIDVKSFQANNPRLYEQFTTSKGDYTMIDGWLMGELEKDYDEWQTKDLRSYLQRPVIRMKSIINACCDPQNNGGYEVELDSDFFNENNPYWENAWMTLPLVTEMEIVDNEVEVSTTTNSDGSFSLSGLSVGDNFDVSINYFITSNADVTIQSDGYGYMLTTGVYTFDRDTPLIAANMAIYSQLVAYDANDNIIAGSNVISLSRKYGKIPSDFTYDLEFDAPVTVVNGAFYYIPNEDYRYRYWSFGGMGSYDGVSYPTYQLKMEKLKYVDGMKFKMVTKIATLDVGTVTGYAGKLFCSEGYDAYPTEPYLSERSNSITSFKTKSAWNVNQNNLLNSEHTPAEYFLSYIKLFNLHIWKDMYDKKIYVYKRENFFNGEIYDIEEYVDRGDEINITPLTFDAKWYNFKYEMETDGVLYKDYNGEYGLEYGIQKIDTNYNFDKSNKDLLDGNAYKGCIMQRGKSKYYTEIYQSFTDDDVYYPPYCLDGIQTFLFNTSGDTVEGSYITPKTTEESINWWTEKYYDIMPKPSFVDKKNEPIEGANVLLFYNGKTALLDANGIRMNFMLTDDLPQFDTLNEGEPCWIWSMDWNVIINPYYLPNFSRYITNENSWITHSWDFGTPKSLYIPDYSIDDSSNLYTQYWKSYIRDMYSVDTRTVDCKVLLKERVVGDWLRRFYYWDGSYWIINEIKDYDCTSNGTTQCTFIRVNDISNYQ